MRGPNYLIGYGERLTEDVAVGPRFGQQKIVYSGSEARDRLVPSAALLHTAVAALPELATPGKRAVAAITMHPQYIARSYFPNRLLRSLDAQVVGSRSVTVTPDRWSRKKPPPDEGAHSSMLFVSAPTGAIAEWADRISTTEGKSLEELRRVETLHLPSTAEKLSRDIPDHSTGTYEIVLHTSGDAVNRYIIGGFERWCARLQVEPDLKRRISAGGLTFIPLRATHDIIPDLAKFSFLRFARPMPRIRGLRPIVTRSVSTPVPVMLPDSDPADTSTSAVVFDGGLPGDSELLRWCQYHDGAGVGPATSDLTSHGHTVTSAILFGSLHTPPQAPYVRVDHYRVLDESSDAGQYELYDVLKRVEDVLYRIEPEFINLSIGPDLPTEDNEVHAWTAVIDEYVARTGALVTVAVGNDGELDWESGNARIQVPSDSVNALGVGASALPGSVIRAPYSCIGPGRSPGVVKPDIVAFGGSDEKPFLVADPDRPGFALELKGTSFASPAALRTALGVRAVLGEVLNPLTLKALLIHCANYDKAASRNEVGWGTIPADTADIIVCPDGVARVIYQGSIDPAKYVRVRLPLPVEPLVGLVTITATFTFASEVDPQDPSVYTRAGLEVFFRPHNQRYADADSQHPRAAGFFGGMGDRTEQALRSDAHKWETVLHRSKRFRPSSLRNPVFDVHYLARRSGTSYRGSPKMRYSLVITSEAPRMPDLYDQVLRAYPTQLEALRPIIQIPVPRIRQPRLI